MASVSAAYIIERMIAAADEIQDASPVMAARLRLYAECSRLKVNPRLAEYPMAFALEVASRTGDPEFDSLE